MAAIDGGTPWSMRAVDLPEARAELIEWHNRHGANYFTACLKDGAQTAYWIHLPDATQGARLADSEADRVAQAELFWVSREMTELCVAAARSMPAWDLRPEDLIAPAGLIYFEGLPDLRPEYPTTAMAWSSCPPDVASYALKGPGIWLSGYVGRDWFAQKGIDLSTARIPFPSLTYDGESICAFGHREEGDVGFTRNEGDEVVETDDESLIKRCSSLVLFKAASLLMRQEFTSETSIEPNSASRKRIRRLGQDPRPVRVINLRRASHSTGAGESEREYHHQWIVRGHWRQQWYPSREVHRPVWIAPHIKGPEGAPLIGGEKVHALVR